APWTFLPGAGGDADAHLEGAATRRAVSRQCARGRPVNSTGAHGRGRGRRAVADLPRARARRGVAWDNARRSRV
ncbi:Os01g0915732, partial [Oryza sativa Japonica Group]